MIEIHDFQTYQASFLSYNNNSQCTVHNSRDVTSPCVPEKGEGDENESEN